ncbi:MAG TPA: hypothetical protein VK465_00465 [Fibrobacteria bacterium]|nr:hypothetical protein [Fibrobacteria bacterium]
MEGFIQDWLKSKGMAKDMLPEAWNQLAQSADGLAVVNPLQPKESAPTATSAPEPATKTSTYNRRAWEIAYAARLAAIDAAAETAARATSNPSSIDSSPTSPAEDTESTPVDTTIAVTPTEENGKGGTSTGDEESSSDPAPGSGGADGTGETEDGSMDGKIWKHGKRKGESK